MITFIQSPLYTSKEEVLAYSTLFLFRFGFDTGSLYRGQGCPGLPYVDLTGLELTEIHQPLPPKALGLQVGTTVSRAFRCLIF